METVKNTDAEKMEEKASLELAAEKLANVSGGTRNEAEEADKKKSACPNWIRKKPTIKGSPDWLLDRHKFRKLSHPRIPKQHLKLRKVSLCRISRLWLVRIS